MSLMIAFISDSNLDMGSRAIPSLTSNAIDDGGALDTTTWSISEMFLTAALISSAWRFHFLRVWSSLSSPDQGDGVVSIRCTGHARHRRGDRPSRTPSTLAALVTRRSVALAYLHCYRRGHPGRVRNGVPDGDMSSAGPRSVIGGRIVPVVAMGLYMSSPNVITPAPSIHHHQLRLDSRSCRSLWSLRFS